MSRKRLGVLIGQAEENMQKSFLQGFMQEAYTLDYDVCVFSMQQKYQETPKREIGDNGIFKLINCDMLDGIVFLKDTVQVGIRYGKKINEQIEEKLHNTFDGPVVVIDSESKYFDTIMVDHRKPVRRLVDHLIEEHGYKDIYFLNGKKGHPHSVQRLQGYMDSMKAHNLEVTEDMIYQGDYWYDSGDAMVDELVKRPEGLPEAIACANDCMAIGVCDRLAKYGYSIPEDIAVIGYDSTEEGRLSPRPLTSAYIPAKSCGIHAFRYLHSKITGEEAPEFDTETEIFHGNSCGCTHECELVSTRRKIWATDLSRVGYNSWFNHIMDDLLAQTDEKEFFYTVFNYVYQIRDFEHFSLCLNSNWNNSTSITSGSAQNQDFSKRITRIIKCGRKEEDDIISFEQEFDKDIMLPELEEDRDYPTTYFFMPLFFEDRLFGYGAISYGREIRVYDEVFRMWIRSVVQCYEAFHRQNALRDMLERIEASQIRDALTGLYNYKGFIHLSQNLYDTGRLQGRNIIITAIDLNRLKEINSGYGRTEGDEAINILARILNKIVVRGELVARMGNDEFVIASVVPDLNSKHGEELIDAINAAIAEYNDSNEKPYKLEVCYGTMIRVVSDVEDLEHLINDTVSLKNGIKQEKQQRRLQEKQLSIEDIENDRIVADILDNNKFFYHFQPIVNAKTGEIYAYEALMRCEGEKKLAPPVILQCAERMNRLYDVEKSTLFNVINYVREHEEAFEGRKIFINSIPGYQLNDEDTEKFRELIWDIRGKAVLEFTEETEIDDESLIRFKKNCENMGLDMAIDDYGSGYSNVNNLLRYMPNYLKIDRMLITEIENNPQKQHFVRDIVEFAHDNDIIALAEGVETAQEMKKVIELGIDLIQGYYTAKPGATPIEHIESRVVSEIIQYSHTEVNRYEKKECVINEAKKVSLLQLTMNKYSLITIDGSEGLDMVEITGSSGFESNIILNVCDGFKGEIVLDNASLAGDKFLPCLEIGEDCEVVLTLIGENRMRTGGIKVPESSCLTIKGDGSLYIDINCGRYFGIGNDYTSRHGRLVFEQDGFIFIKANGMKGIGIGSGLGGEIEIRRGGYDIEINGQEGVGIGAIDADSKLSLEYCDILINYGVTNGAIIGSIMGKANVFIENASARVITSGNNIVAIGTLLGDESKIDICNANINISMLGSKQCFAIGGATATTALDVRFAKLAIECQGKTSLAVGDINKTSRMTVFNSTLDINVTNNNNEDIGIVPENISITNGKASFVINNEIIFREIVSGEF